MIGVGPIRRSEAGMFMQMNIRPNRRAGGLGHKCLANNELEKACRVNWS